MDNIILLNADYSFLSLIDWKKAFRLIWKDKVEIIKKSEKNLTSASGKKITIPHILRLINLVRHIYKSKVAFSKKNIYIRDLYTCQYCGKRFYGKEKKLFYNNDGTKKIDYLTTDHVVPKGRGGKTNFENCVSSCKDCNNKKGCKTPNEANMSLKKIPFQPTISEFFMLKLKSLGLDKILEEIWEF